MLASAVARESGASQRHVHLDAASGFRGERMTARTCARRQFWAGHDVPWSVGLGLFCPNKISVF
jgi:hypothetical protein